MGQDVGAVFQHPLHHQVADGAGGNDALLAGFVVVDLSAVRAAGAGIGRGRLKAGFDRAGAQHGNADAVAGQFLPQLLAERDGPGLGDVIGADRNALESSKTAERTGATVSGPVPLPTEKNVYCVIRSPFKDKDSREHFEIRTHKRLIDILQPSPKTVDSLQRLDSLPAGVDIEIKL